MAPTSSRVRCERYGPPPTGEGSRDQGLAGGEALRYRGPDEAIAEWLPALKEHKAEVLAIMLGAEKPPDAPMKPLEVGRLMVWLGHIEETDAGIIAEVLALCRRDADARGCWPAIGYTGRIGQNNRYDAGRGRFESQPYSVNNTPQIAKVKKYLMAQQMRPAFCDSAKRSGLLRPSGYKEPERANSIMARALYRAHEQAGYIHAVFLTSHHRSSPCKAGWSPYIRSAMMTTLRIGNELYNLSKSDPQPQNDCRLRLIESPIGSSDPAGCPGTSSLAFSRRAISLRKILITGISGIGGTVYLHGRRAAGYRLSVDVRKARGGV